MEIDIVPNNKLPVYFLCMNQILGGIDFILKICFKSLFSTLLY